MSSAIEVSHLAKRYILGANQTSQFREAMVETLQAVFLRKKQPPVEHWALRDVSFKIDAGEVVGVIGRNGAGKSTLLKILSKITYPTKGDISVNGRVASLLEVGTGFHEELSGRENIFLNGSIMGMRREAIQRRFAEIVEFSGVEKFIDTPIKRYSSGMRLRLGFAVAAHLDPEILLVDEVLAVGDAEFQRKCLAAMDGLRSGGRTVIFVSHSMAAIEGLCSRCIWIDAGVVRQDGPAEEVVHDYMATFAKVGGSTSDLESIETRVGNGFARVTGIEFRDPSGQPMALVRSGDKFTLRMFFKVTEPIRDLHVGIEVYSEMGQKITISNNWMTGFDIPQVKPGRGYVDLDIDCFNLMPGRFYLTAWLKGPQIDYDVLENCVTMDVETSNFFGTGRGITPQFGMIFLPGRWHSDGLPTG